MTALASFDGYSVVHQGTGYWVRSPIGFSVAGPFATSRDATAELRRMFPQMDARDDLLNEIRRHGT